MPRSARPRRGPDRSSWFPAPFRALLRLAPRLDRQIARADPAAVLLPVDVGAGFADCPTTVVFGLFDHGAAGRHESPDGTREVQGLLGERREGSRRFRSRGGSRRMCGEPHGFGRIFRRPAAECFPLQADVGAWAFIAAHELIATARDVGTGQVIPRFAWQEPVPGPVAASVPLQAKEQEAQLTTPGSRMGCMHWRANWPDCIPRPTNPDSADRRGGAASVESGAADRKKAGAERGVEVGALEGSCTAGVILIGRIVERDLELRGRSHGDALPGVGDRDRASTYLATRNVRPGIVRIISDARTLRLRVASEPESISGVVIERYRPVAVGEHQARRDEAAPAADATGRRARG